MIKNEVVCYKTFSLINVIRLFVFEHLVAIMFWIIIRTFYYGLIVITVIVHAFVKDYFNKFITLFILHKIRTA